MHQGATTIASAVTLEPPPWTSVWHLISSSASLFLLLLALSVARLILHPLLSPFAASLRKGNGALGSFAAFLGLLDESNLPYTLIRAVVSGLLCILYVVTTYLGRIPPMFHAFQATCGIVFLLRALGNLFMSPLPLSLVFTGEMIIEVLSIPSLVLARGDVWLNLSFLQAYIVLFNWKLLEKNRYIVIHDSPVARKLTSFAFKFTILIYVFACGQQLLELLGDPHEVLTATTFELTIANALYFCVATIFTVGYGDFVPYTLFGRMWIVGVIVFGAYLVARQVSQVIDVLVSRRKGMGWFVKPEGTQHILLCGNIKLTYLKNFIAEFYSVPSNIDTKIVVMTTNPQWTEEEWNSYLTSLSYKSMIEYLEGNCTSNEDLGRANVETVKAAFVLCSHHAKDPYLEDSETLKRILMLRAYRQDLPIYAMCALRDSMLQFSFALEHIAGESRPDAQNLLGDHVPLDQSGFQDDFSDDEDDDFMLVSGYDGSSDVRSDAICLQEFETSLLAENIFCNGLSTLLSNLLLHVGPETKANDTPWMSEYKIGADCRLECIKLPSPFWGKLIGDILLILYDYGIILIATKRRAERKWRPATLETTIQLNTIGLAITYHNPVHLEQVVDHAAVFVLNRDKERDEENAREAPSVQKDLLHPEQKISDIAREPEDTKHPAEVPTLSSSPPAPQPKLTKLRDVSEGEQPVLAPNESLPSASNQRKTKKVRSLAKVVAGGTRAPEKRVNNAEDVSTKNAAEKDQRRSRTDPARRMRVRKASTFVGSSRKSTTLSSLREHIIVCVFGRMGLLNLKYFLHHVSLKRLTVSKAPQVVAISSRLTLQDERILLAQRNAENLFLLRGNCMSVKTLRRAQYKHAKAIVILSCEDDDDDGADSVDSKAIFTLMTLDYLLGARSPVFVCSIMDAEESMRLLRAPEFPRRTGASAVKSPSRMPKGFRMSDCSRSEALARHVSSDTISDDILSSLPFLSANSSTNVVAATRSFTGMPSTIQFNFNLNYNLKQSLPFVSDSVPGEKAKAKTGRSREELFERQRYASGEMLLSSLYVGLLIRESALPGLMAIVQRIFGASMDQSARDKRCWIRLLKVPKKWARQEARARTFRNLIQVLLKHGCIPLGLYRTGTVPIRLEVDKDHEDKDHEDREYLDQSGLDSPGANSVGEAEHRGGYGSMWRIQEENVEQRGASDAPVRDKGLSEIDPVSLGDAHSAESHATHEPDMDPRLKEYCCPTTQRRQVYEELEGGGENVLPYVYTYPEPFTLVGETDSVYVLAHPSLVIPDCW